MFMYFNFKVFRGIILVRSKTWHIYLGCKCKKNVVVLSFEPKRSSDLS